MNTKMLSFFGDTEKESNRLSVVANDQDETVHQDSIHSIDLRSSTLVNVPGRRVSGVRCFPLGCGGDPACLNKKDLEKVLAGSRNHCLPCKICTKEEEPFVEEETEQEDCEVVVMEEENKDEMVEKEEEEVTKTDDIGGTMDAKLDSIASIGVRSNTLVNVPSRRVSGVRCFPLGCGGDSACLNREDLEKVLAKSRNHCLPCKICAEEEVEEVTMTDDIGGTMTAKLDSIDSIDIRSSTLVNVPSRRVSGVRCFPLGCGGDLACLNKEDLAKVLADSRNHCLPCKICTEEDEPFVEEETEQDDDEVVVMEKEKEDEMVEKEEEVRMTDDIGGTMDAKLEVQRVVVIALKASRSPCTQNARAKPTAEGELKQEAEKIRSPGYKEEQRKIRTPGYKEEQRVVVQALMASTRCPWRNSHRGKRSSIRGKG